MHIPGESEQYTAATQNSVEVLWQFTIYLPGLLALFTESTNSNRLFTLFCATDNVSTLSLFVCASDTMWHALKVYYADAVVMP